jgi:hypothetical protein
LKPLENRTKSPVFKWSAIFLPFEIQTKVFLTSSLDRFDRFVMNKMNAKRDKRRLVPNDARDERPRNERPHDKRLRDQSRSTIISWAKILLFQNGE